MTNISERYCVEILKKERAQCNFIQEELTELLDGGKEMTAFRRKMCKSFINDPIYNDEIPLDYLSHEDGYINELRKVCHTLKLLKAENYTVRQYLEFGPNNLMKEGNPLSVHMSMFLGALSTHSNDEQKKKWLTRAEKGEIIGTYAQTELGHGTFIRGLETTATYDPESEEFILHSPTITSTKWWPGGLGKTANYAIVMAQLYIEGNSYGPHPFLVQIRSEETHHSMPGVTIGEIGPRIGVKCNDNGFLRFDNYHIPRNNMLMKFSQVLQDGTYNPPVHVKLAYSSMIIMRVSLLVGCYRHLQNAVTIATRYSAVRHQSELVPGEPEPQILDYQTQQYKLLPHIASVFALHFSAQSLSRMLTATTINIEEGNLDMLPELHILSSGLKALGSSDSTEGIEVCRLACGGHGYLCSSSFSHLYGAITGVITAEGENTVLWLQVARHLIKSYRAVCNGKSVHGAVSYLTDQPAHARTECLSNEGLVEAFKISTASMISAVYAKLERALQSGQDYHHAWNNCSIQLVKCAQAHIRYCVCKEFVRSLETLDASEGVSTLLRSLCRLYLIYHITLNKGNFLKCGSLSVSNIEVLENELGDLLAALRLQAVSIVDSFDIDDKLLDSTLGCWDGNVYERLYEEAQKSPLNQKDVPEAYYKYLQPLMKSSMPAKL